MFFALLAKTFFDWYSLLMLMFCYSQ